MHFLGKFSCTLKPKQPHPNPPLPPQERELSSVMIDMPASLEGNL
jgi:hypothetical protein